MADEVYTINSPKEMKLLAARQLTAAAAGDTWLLDGELGAGKTTFVQGAAEAAGLAEPVTSPTFTIVADYPVPPPHRLKRFVHVDLYRLTDAEAQTEPAVLEVLAQAGRNDRLTVIEWADKLGVLKPRQAVRIYFAHGAAPTERTVRVMEP